MTIANDILIDALKCYLSSLLTLNNIINYTCYIPNEYHANNQYLVIIVREDHLTADTTTKMSSLLKSYLDHDAILWLNSLVQNLVPKWYLPAQISIGYIAVLFQR